jgi:medium-chain acyl-[acyl-carrier-protein] hydrolase
MIMSHLAAPDGWLTKFEPNDKARVRLFCFPYAGGGAYIFRGWSKGLPPTVEVCSIQLPGRQNRLKEPPLTRLSTLVERVAQAMRVYLDKPFAFFGHSMGALVGFELARYLRREDSIEPVRLFVSGHAAPQLPAARPPIHNLPTPQFKEKLRDLNGTPEDFFEHPELMQLALPILRADFQMIETYAYTAEAPLSCPIAAFGGLKDYEVSREHLEAWREQTTAGFTLRMFDGCYCAPCLKSYAGLKARLRKMERGRALRFYS